MAYDESTAQRVREVVARLQPPGLEERKMFGGVAFMIQGNMACGVLNDDVIVRVGRDKYGEAVIRPHARPFDITGRPMKGWVMVAAEGHRSEEALADWVAQGVAFALTLPPK